MQGEGLFCRRGGSTKPAANGRTRRLREMCTAQNPPPARTYVLSASLHSSIVIYLFISLSAKGLLLENTHSKNGASNKGRPQDREETLYKGAETVQAIQKKIVPESHMIKASAAPGLF